MLSLLNCVLYHNFLINESGLCSKIFLLEEIVFPQSTFILAVMLDLVHGLDLCTTFSVVLNPDCSSSEEERAGLHETTSNCQLFNLCS